MFEVRQPRALSPASTKQALRSSEETYGLPAARRRLIGARAAVLATVAATDAGIKKMVRASLSSCWVVPVTRIRTVRPSACSGRGISIVAQSLVWRPVSVVSIHCKGIVRIHFEY